MTSPVVQACTAFAVLGVASHLGFFIRGDLQLLAPKLFVAAITAPVVSTAYLVRTYDTSILTATALTTLFYLSYLVPLGLSAAIYRGFFHPLTKFPGPAAARFTALHHVKSSPEQTHFRHLDKLHAQYGEYVRISPKVLSVANPDIVEMVHGYRSNFTKNEWYLIGQPMTSLHQMTDVPLHDRRRKHGWDKAFTSKALRSYDARIMNYTDTLVRQMHQRSGQNVNMTEWMNYFAFDVMGDLAFGRSFGALEGGKPHWFIDLLHEQGKLVGTFLMMPWLIHLASRLPAFLNPMNRMLDYSLDCVDERRTREPDEPDIMSHIFEAGDFFEDPFRERMLFMGDARLIVIAGSDTTATTLVYIAWYLATQPAVIKRLRAELSQHQVVNDETFSVSGLSHLGYLNGIINEALRLHPPVPGGLQRSTPEEGLQIGDVFIPPNTTVITPHYTIQRSPKAFVKPNDFIPERWSTQPDLVLNKDAWFPFTIGRYSCIGKQLALNELRAVVAKLALEFDFSLAAGETGHELMEKSRDIFTMSNAKLDVVLQSRVVSP